jgi:hypothetical protein
MLLKRSTFSVHSIHVQVQIALCVAMSATDPPPTIDIQSSWHDLESSSSWLHASHVWAAGMTAGYHGKGKIFGSPTLLTFGSVQGLTRSMDEGMGRLVPSPSGTTIEGFGSVKGKSKGSGSVMDQGKGQGIGQPTLESLDSHDDYGKGKGKGNGRSELDKFFRVWADVQGKCKGKGCGEPNYAELLSLMESCNIGVMGGSEAGELASGSGE